ncbi:MAG: hypothetical protein ACRDQ2_09565 [Gaiellales bacterium]
MAVGGGTSGTVKNSLSWDIAASKMRISPVKRSPLKMRPSGAMVNAAGKSSAVATGLAENVTGHAGRGTIVATASSMVTRRRSQRRPAPGS